MPFDDRRLLRTFRDALAAIPAADAPDIYAISFFIDHEDDDPRKPTITIGYNTESQVKRVLKHTDGRHPGPAEARWNYAWWLQNELAIIGDSSRDPEGAAYLTQRLNSTPEFRENPGQFTTRLIRSFVRFAHSLQEVGLIERAIGHRAPVLIHQLEYSEQTARQTEAANPPGLADDFAAWARNQ
jgi:hypothetical protein